MASSITVIFVTANATNTTSTTNVLKVVVIVLLVIYVPYSFFLALKYVVIVGKVFHLRDTDFWFDFHSVWVWLNHSCCLSTISNTIDLIKLTRMLFLKESYNFYRNSNEEDNDRRALAHLQSIGLEVNRLTSAVDAIASSRNSSRSSSRSSSSSSSSSTLELLSLPWNESSVDSPTISDNRHTWGINVTVDDDDDKDVADYSTTVADDTFWKGAYDD